MKIERIFLVMALLFLSTCLLGSAAQAQTNNSVTIQDFAFEPNILTIPVGVAVTWTNHDSTQHEVVSDNGTFDSGILMPDDQFSYTFSQPGNYSYYCKIHPYMFGQIQVTRVSAMMKVMSADSGKDPVPKSSLSSHSSMFSQYFSMESRTTTKDHITSPKNYPMKNLGSMFVYFNVPKYTTSYYSQTYFTPDSYQMYSMPFAQYYSNYASYSGSTSLWIQGTSGLTQYVTVPLGASLSLLAMSPTGGNGYLYEMAPGGKWNINYYYFNQYNQMNFNADTIGEYVLMISINGRMSNAITINVVSPGSSYSMPSYQAPSYQQQPGYIQPSSSYQSSGGY